MMNCKNEVVEYLDYLEKVLEKNRENLEALDSVPKGRLRVTKNHGTYQYFFKEEGRNERYLHADEKEKVVAIAQLYYEQKLCKHLNKSIIEVKRFLDSHDFECINKTYQQINAGRRMLIEPIEPTDEMVIKEWLTKYEGGQNPYPEEGKFITEQGERVRSKSEKIIADMFHKYGLIYCYEPKIILNRKRTVYPDFAILNINRRKTYLWEHLGLISDEDYEKKNMSKIDIYERNGYVLGDNLIISLETAEKPIDIELVEYKINKLLLK